MSAIAGALECGTRSRRGLMEPTSHAKEIRTLNTPASRYYRRISSENVNAY